MMSKLRTLMATNLNWVTVSTKFCLYLPKEKSLKDSTYQKYHTIKRNVAIAYHDLILLTWSEILQIYFIIE